MKKLVYEGLGLDRMADRNHTPVGMCRDGSGAPVYGIGGLALCCNVGDHAVKMGVDKGCLGGGFALHDGGCCYGWGDQAQTMKACNVGTGAQEVEYYKTTCWHGPMT